MSGNEFLLRIKELCADQSMLKPNSQVKKVGYNVAFKYTAVQVRALPKRETVGSNDHKMVRCSARLQLPASTATLALLQSTHVIHLASRDTAHLWLIKRNLLTIATPRLPCALPLPRNPRTAAIAQLGMLALLWTLKSFRQTALFFPSVIGLLVVVRLFALPQMFSVKELDELDEAVA
jgi:hypothetical protein